MARPKEIDKEAVQDALDSEGTVYSAAKKLGCTRQTVYYHMRQHDIPNPKTGNVPSKG